MTLNIFLSSSGKKSWSIDGNDKKPIAGKIKDNIIPLWGSSKHHVRKVL